MGLGMQGYGSGKKSNKDPNKLKNPSKLKPKPKKDKVKINEGGLPGMYVNKGYAQEGGVTNGYDMYYNNMPPQMQQQKQLGGNNVNISININANFAPTHKDSYFNYKP